MVRRENAGVALPLLLLILLALTALGHGALLMARGELRATWAFRHSMRAERGAEMAVRLGLEGWVPWEEGREAGRNRLLVSGETEEGLVFRSTLRWLNREFFTVEAMGGSRGWEGERRRTWVGWSLDPRERIGAFEGSFEVGRGMTSEGGVVGGGEEFFGSPQGWEPKVCEDYRDLLDSLFSGGSLPPEALREVSGPEDTGPGASIPPLGLLTGSHLLELAGGTSPDPGLPAGGVDACTGETDPLFFGGEGPVEITGGRVCGLLVASGDVRLGRGTIFQGIALVGGDLLLEGGAMFEGMARVGEGVLLEPGAELRPNACPALWALDHLPALSQPLFPPGARGLNGY